MQYQKDFASTYEQSRWEYDVATYERNKIRLGMLKAYDPADYSERYMDYVAKRIESIEQEQQKLLEKYGNKLS